MTTTRKPPRTCPTCALDFGWHYTDDLVPRAYRCPNYVTAELVEQARDLTLLQNEQATRAAQQIITDAAHTLPEFSANQIREALEAAQIPGPIVGAAFAWAASDKATEHGPLITASGRFVQSTEASTRHRIQVWQSRVYGKASA